MSARAALGLLVLLPLSPGPAAAQTPMCQKDLVHPWGLVTCTAPGNPVPFTCGAAPNGGGDCQNAANGIACGAAYCDPNVFVYLSPETKAKIKLASDDFQMASLAIGGYAVICALAGPGAPLCTSWLGTAAGISTAVSLALYLVWRVDPPDPNYDQVVVMVPYPYEPTVATCSSKTQPRKCDMTPAEAELVNDLFNTESRIQGLSDAIVTTTNRAVTALSDGDIAAYRLQVAALADFRTRLSAKLARDASVRETLAPLMLQNQREWMTNMSHQLGDPVFIDRLRELSTEVLP
jgi:hypothetical protein